ncbi:uncharacterized protein LOC6575951 [Drosophila mojavensis]|uniref:Uncharacterized protein n=1 Tax=Drosophila mojavensis TaxID=7230 RepID=B4KJ35_DROMO|nr:uncharacterized protein LOC6575951 [Drosophila mojavensis]EDW11397.2 uncharacterized protein Dmoj_GI17120 [Drosophila mojavensis]
MKTILIVKVIFLMAAMEAGAQLLPSTPPVVIWGAKLTEPRNIFHTIKSKKFAARLRPLLKDHMLIAYLAPLLTSKDLSCLQPDCFAYLRKVEPRTYYSKIRKPVAALGTLLAEHNQELVWSERDKMLHLPCKKGHIYAYNFQTQNLTEHDKFMETVASNLTACQLVQIYTAHGEPTEEIERRIRRTDQAKGRTLAEQPIAEPQMQTKSQMPSNISHSEPIAGAENQTTEVMVFRHPKAIITLSTIVYAEQYSAGVSVYYKRQYIRMTDAVKFDIVLRDPKNIKKGVALLINTTAGNLRLILLPVVGNWRIYTLIFRNVTHMPRDLLFYSNKFSFCCQSLNAYSKEGGRVSLQSLSMDVVVADNVTATDPDYIPKTCWLCAVYLTPALTQTLFTVAILLVMLVFGISIFFNMGQNNQLPNGNDPNPFVKSH